MISFEQYDVFLIGGGGHARVLLDIISLRYPEWKIAILDRNETLVGSNLMGSRILGGDELLEEISIINPGVRFSVSIGSVGNSNTRKQLFQKGIALGLTPQTLIHPTAIVSSFAQVSEGAQLLPSCIVNSGARIGMNAIINSGAIVEHDCIVMEHAHIATGALLTSGVVVGKGAHVGAGASVRQSLQIGDGAIIGIGAAVIRNVPPGAVVGGVPAKSIVKRKNYG